MFVYWIVKYEIFICKFVFFFQFLEKVGVIEMKYFIYRLVGSVREFFFIFGQVIFEQLFEKVYRLNFVGFLCDDVIDIVIFEQFISFIQFVDFDFGEVCMDFFFVENVLVNSKLVDVQILFIILILKL